MNNHIKVVPISAKAAPAGGRFSTGKGVARPAFLAAMSQMASTVCVVTADSGGAQPGRTVTAIFSLSAEPPMVLVSIKTESVLAQAILAGSGFSVAMLSEGQELIADAFAGKVESDRRYLIGVWGEWPSGRPRLFASASSLDCALAGATPMADHTLFAGLVIASDVTESLRPLIWHDRRYAALKNSYEASRI